jgi:hypothetical protein
VVDAPRKLYAKWSKRERAIVYGGTNKPDGGMLAYEFEGAKGDFGRTLVKELEERGYDITTLQFSVAKKPPPPPPPVVMARAGAVGVDADGREIDA